jgi:hypothetical protein
MLGANFFMSQDLPIAMSFLFRTYLVACHFCQVGTQALFSAVLAVRASHERAQLSFPIVQVAIYHDVVSATVLERCFL